MCVCGGGGEGVIKQVSVYVHTYVRMYHLQRMIEFIKKSLDV